MKYRKQSMYVPVLAVALGLFMYGAYAGAPGDAFARASRLVASVSVGASAAVEPNAYNTLAQQLDAKQKELDVLESNLAAKSEALVQKTDTMLPLASFIMSVILTVLVGINFYLDWRRGTTKVSLPFAQVINLKSRG